MMGYTTWLAVLIMGFAVIGMAAAETTPMSGGTVVDVDGTGFSEGHAYEFSYDGGDAGGYIEANILASATAEGVSSARIKTSVPTLQSMSKTYGGNTLKVSAQGTVEATAEGQSEDAEVTSVAEIRARAEGYKEYTDTDGVYHPPVEGGFAYIKSVIEGKDSPITKGCFYADSIANGEATYSVTAPDVELSGGVDGKTRLEAESTSDHANLGDADAPLRAEIASRAIRNVDEIGAVTAAVHNTIQLNAVNDGLRADSLSYASGTVEDTSASASGRVQDGQTGEHKVSATKSAKMSADVRVLKALDSASAISVLGTDATVDQDGTADANAFARTYAAVNRENAGSKADGSDRAWARHSYNQVAGMPGVPRWKVVS